MRGTGTAGRQPALLHWLLLCVPAQKADGAIAFYEAKLGPWLKYLSLRTNNYLFHNKSLYEQTKLIFGEYGAFPDWDWHVAGFDTPMTDACQFGESDHNYLSRRWEAAGLLYFYEHGEAGHKLVLTDSSIDAAPIDGDVEIPFQRHDGARDEDGIGDWSPTRRIMPARISVSRFDFKDPVQNFRNTISLPTLNQQGTVPQIESYEYAGAHGFKNSEDGDRLVRLRLEEVEAVGKHFDAAGNNRCAMPRRWFRLIDHFDDNDSFDHRGVDQNEFLIIDVRHCATNNYLQQAEFPSDYSNRLTCIRKMIPWRPGRGYNSVDTKFSRRRRPPWSAPQDRTASMSMPMAGSACNSTGTASASTTTEVRSGCTWSACGPAASSAPRRYRAWAGKFALCFSKEIRIVPSSSALLRTNTTCHRGNYRPSKR